MIIQVLVALGVVLIIAAVLLRRPRARRFALIGGIISLVVATVLNPDILLAFADEVSTVLDGKPPE
jgi:hypothetical protein